MRAPIQRLLGWSWPRDFAVVQFPNPPLMVAIVAGVAGKAAHGGAHRLALSAFYLALGVWAYGEAVRGDNWFRRLLGVGLGVYVFVRLSQHLRA